jgi:hypothetical protein
MESIVISFLLTLQERTKQQKKATKDIFIISYLVDPVKAFNILNISEINH